MSTFADSTLYSPPHAVFEGRDQVRFLADAVLFFGEFETRSKIPISWSSQLPEHHVFRIEESGEANQISIDRLPESVFSLRDNRELRKWIVSLNCSIVYLDITGLGHNIWMPLLRILFEEKKPVQCIYTEPSSYTANPNPKPGDFYDLSEKVRGFSPIPTFARIPTRLTNSSVMIPLLGFEGIRFKHLVETFEPNEREIYPVIGVPGFEVEYPFHTFEGNADPLRTTRSWQRIDFVDAACPFSLFNLIRRLRSEIPNREFQVATIGTKPHALGAVLYALQDKSCDILYDHPVRKQGRTDGSGKCHLYDIATFWQLGF